MLQPSSLNSLIGAPEVDKPMTQVVCDATGTLTIEQQGTSFSGSGTQKVLCTVDGQEFVPPPFAFNPAFAIRNGRIQGHSVHFDTGHIIGNGAPVPPQPQDCTNRGSITVRDGLAERLRVVGSCPVPFDPGEQHSEWTIVKVAGP